MAAPLPEKHRLRPRELFFVFLGATTGGALGVLWFKLVPEVMDGHGLSADTFSGLAALCVSPLVQALVLAVGAVLLAAGLATRMSSGKDTATWIMAAGDVLLFGALAVSVNVLYEPVLSRLGQDPDEASEPELDPEQAAQAKARAEAAKKAIVEDDWED